MSSPVTRVGAGVVNIPPQEASEEPKQVETQAAVDKPVSVEVVPEEDRICEGCGRPVGRSRNNTPALIEGFCIQCGTPFDFRSGTVPRLEPGECVAGQYEVIRTLKHGGMGQVFLARDRNVSDRLCVLKGILEEDEAATLAMEADRKYLAELSQHPNIVTIHNYVNHRDRGYIVMEYLRGHSLIDKRTTRGPLPVTEAISYIHAVLPALSHMHRLKRAYCDFKPDNVMHVGDEVKLVDLGAVHPIDSGADIFGTYGYQADEVPTDGPTVESDLFTVGRTLAVLILNWPGWANLDVVADAGVEQKKLVNRLPKREDHEVLVQHDCLWRFLERACAHHARDRFSNADEMAGQLYGVLCQVAAAEERSSRPYRSTRWGEPEPTLDLLGWRGLPRPVLPDQPGRRSRLAGMAEGDSAVQAFEKLREDERSWADRAAAVLAYCERDPEPASKLGKVSTKKQRESDLDRAAKLAEKLRPPDEASTEHAATIRAARKYLQGLVGLARSEALGTTPLEEEAPKRFEEAYVLAPGEAACALAYATAREHAVGPLSSEDEEQDIMGLYDQVALTHPTWTAAVSGLARTLDVSGQHEAAARALLAVPEAHPLRADALTQACTYMKKRAHLDDRIASEAVRYLDNTRPLNRPAPDVELAATLYRTLVAIHQAGAPIPARLVRRSEAGATADKPPVAQEELRRLAEASLRELAHIVPNPARRHELLDDAAKIRPPTWW